jgi:hypothetical protein
MAGVPLWRSMCPVSHSVLQRVCHSRKYSVDQRFQAATAACSAPGLDGRQPLFFSHLHLLFLVWIHLRVKPSACTVANCLYKALESHSVLIKLAHPFMVFNGALKLCCQSSATSAAFIYLSMHSSIYLRSSIYLITKDTQTRGHSQLHEMFIIRRILPRPKRSPTNPAQP